MSPVSSVVKTPLSEKRLRRGLVVGKFSPLHRGHMLVIEAALAQCAEVVVITYSVPEFPGCEAPRRERWLRALFPTAIILVVADADTPANDAPDDVHRCYCARLLRERLHTTVDAVFTSEDYGAGFAAVLCDEFGSAVAHVCVDRARVAAPISGMQLRADVHAHRAWLHPEVYADFVERVCFLGAESTGKSTLAAACAQEFGTTHVPEFGRELWEARGGELRFEDYRTIVETQLAREAAAIREVGVNRYVFGDTSPLTTLFYQLEQFGRADPVVEAAATSRTYDHVFLCVPDFPLVQDGTRQDEAFRQRQHAWYVAELSRLQISHVRLTGDLRQRIARIADTLSPPTTRTRR